MQHFSQQVRKWCVLMFAQALELLRVLLYQMLPLYELLAVAFTFRECKRVHTLNPCCTRLP